MTSHVVAESQGSPRPPREELFWTGAAAMVGFAVPAMFSSLIGLSRDQFVAVYGLIVAVLLAGYVRWSEIDLGLFLRRRWAGGIIGAVVVGALMVASVQRMPASPRPGGVELVWNLAWLGVVYGTVDALLLTVLPVVTVWRACTAAGWTRRGSGAVAAGIAAFVASLVVTAAYHLGYSEFRGPSLVAPLIGNAAMTLGYLLAGSPLTAIGAHIALHVASVLHGVETTVTLPPHS